MEGGASQKKNLLFYYKFNIFNYVFNRILKSKKI